MDCIENNMVSNENLIDSDSNDIELILPSYPVNEKIRHSNETQNDGNKLQLQLQLLLCKELG